MIDICLLGTGGMMPLPNRWLTSLLVRYNGKMILIDCGEGTQIPLKMAGWGLKAIDAVLFTHYHADHIAGLPGFLLSLGNSGREEPLTLIGPSGLKRAVEGLTVISPELTFELRLVELPVTEPYSEVLNGLIVRSIPVDHSMPCFSYSIELERQGEFDAVRARNNNIPVMYWKRLQKGEIITLENRIISPKMVLGEKRKGIKVCYCTDTRPTEGLVELAAGSDLFICEGMYGDKDSLEKAIQKKHMMFIEAAELSKRAKVKQLWLTHYSPALTEPEEFIYNAKEIFDNSIAGRDLMSVTLKYDD